MWFDLSVADVIAGTMLAFLSFLLLKRQILGFFDPLLIQAVLTALSVAVYLFSIPKGINYEYGAVLLSAYFCALLVAGMAFKRVRAHRLQFEVRPAVQRYSAYVIAAVMTVVLFVNYIFGHSPILHGGGYESRVLVSENNRILEYCARLMPALAILMLASKITRVRRFAWYSIALGVIIFILQGNRAGAIYPVLVLLNYIFIRTLFHGEEMNPKALKRLKVGLIIFGGLVFIGLPAYISSVSDIDPSLVYQLVASRIFLSLDGLFIAGWSSADLSNSGLSAIVMYFQPIFKLFSITNGEFNSVMDYVNYVENGLIPGEYNGPTDNIFVEAMVFFSSPIVAFIFVFLATLVPLYIRANLMSRRSIGFCGWILASIFLISPLNLVLLGYLSFVDAIFLLFISMGLAVPYLLLKKRRHELLPHEKPEIVAST